MKTLDRVILGTLAAGIWAWVSVSVFSSSPSLAQSIEATEIAQSIEATEIDGLEDFVMSVVESCSVELRVREGQGKIQKGSVSC